MTKNSPELETKTIAETENFLIWKADEPDGETTYHIELGNVTLHFFQEEWKEFLDYAGSLASEKPDENGFYAVEFYNVGVWLDEEDWIEFKKLIVSVLKS